MVPNDVLAHTRACCDVWRGNIARILADEHPTFAGMNPRTWMKKTDYPEWPFEAAFSAFSIQREDLLSALEALRPDDWERTATVTLVRPGKRAYGALVHVAAGEARANARGTDRANPDGHTLPNLLDANTRRSNLMTDTTEPITPRDFQGVEGLTT